MSRRKPPRNARNIHTPGSVSIQDNAKDRLYKLANSISGYQQTPVGADDPLKGRFEEIKRDHFPSRDMDNSHDASMSAVPEHHLREERLKQRKMKELQTKNRKKKQNKQPGDVDFEKMFGKDIDEFLEDSD